MGPNFQNFANRKIYTIYIFHLILTCLMNYFLWIKWKTKNTRLSEQTKYQTVRTDKIPDCQNRQNTRLSEQTKYQTVRTDKIPDCQNRQNTRLSEQTKYQTVRTDTIPDCQNRQNTRLSEQTKYQTVRTDKIPDCQNRQNTRLSEQTTYQTVRTDKIGTHNTQIDYFIISYYILKISCICLTIRFDLASANCF